jgi:superfamily II DNA or RNA helicase
VSDLRPYQVDLIARVQAAYREGAQAVCAQCPTGAGKTHLSAAGIIAPSLARGRRTLFLADLEEILIDTRDRLRALGLPAAAITRGRAEDPTAPVQVASQQTLTSWLSRGVELPPADRVILDECHGPAPPRRARFSRRCGGAAQGCSASRPRPRAATANPSTNLTPSSAARACATSSPWAPSCGPRCSRPTATWRRASPKTPPASRGQPVSRGRRACIFVPTAAEADRVAGLLTQHGQPAAAVLDGMARDERRAVRERLASGALQHVVTVRALQKGFDAPVLDTAILASGGSTIVGYLQSIGRVLRPCPGKPGALVYDLRGYVYLHGLPEQDRVWSLEGSQGRTASERAPDLRRCRECHAVFEPRTRCPRCGSVLVADPRPMRVQRAELYAQSGVAPELRAARYVEAVERRMVERGMPVHVAGRIAREKAPAWVREALRGWRSLRRGRGPLERPRSWLALGPLPGVVGVAQHHRHGGIRLRPSRRFYGVGGPGAPDLLCEVRAATGSVGRRVAGGQDCRRARCGPDQRRWHEAARAEGRHVYTVRSVADALEIVQSTGCAMGEPARVIQGPWAPVSLPATTARVFTADLPASWPGYAPRDGQLSLTRAVAETIEAGGGLVAEGPCGTGKGLAYLVPAILRAQASGRGALVATASIALQEQLVAKDLPALAEVWRASGRHPFTWALLKGRGNYLCKARADYSVEHARDLQRIDAWARTTTTGDRAELPFAVADGAWALRSSTQDDCLRDGCEHYGSCHAMEARTRAAEVDVLVVNHHLLAAHIAVRLETGADVVLPRTAPEGAAHAWDCVVVDEAHELGDIARDFLGADFGPWSVAGLARWARDVGEDRVSRDVSEAWDALWLAVERLCPAPARGQAEKPAVLGEGRALDRARLEAVGESLGAVARVARRIAREAKEDVNAPGRPQGPAPRGEHAAPGAQGHVLARSPRRTRRAPRRGAVGRRAAARPGPRGAAAWPSPRRGGAAPPRAVGRGACGHRDERDDDHRAGRRRVGVDP